MLWSCCQKTDMEFDCCCTTATKGTGRPSGWRAYLGVGGENLGWCVKGFCSPRCLPTGEEEGAEGEEGEDGGGEEAAGGSGQHSC